MRFPKFVHLTRETQENGPSWFDVHASLDTIDSATQTIAIYKLVSIGHVSIEKHFIEHPSKNTR